METRFIAKDVEKKILDMWQKKGLNKTVIDKTKKPFCVILPPPNANGSLHLGHAMYVYEDVMIRYHKMIGDCIHWQSGMDHAGIETQFVFEKELKKQGKSRFDYSREELFKMIFEFTQKNKENIKEQFGRLGFFLDWSNEKFPLDKKIILIVYETFKKLFDAGLVYRKKRLVNYCINCGTSFSDLEVEYQEKVGSLYFIKYPFKKNSDEFITVATTRPETMLGDTAVVVNPSDKRYKNLIGEKVVLPLMDREIPIIADQAVDPEFATGAVKVTPAHDETDWQIGERHGLSLIQVIGNDGKMTKEAGKFKGLTISKAREQIVEELKTKGFLEKIKEYQNRVGRCYKCNRVIEPLPKEQWFIRIKPLSEKAKTLIEKDEIKIYPKRFKKVLIEILDNFIDWNISRQIVWGIRIPAYHCKNPKDGWFVSLEKPDKCQICGNCDFEQDEDTFDTWFSSSQWPFATLMAQGDDYFQLFYPTSVMETGYDILRAWVARMIMMDYFVKEKIPFKNIFLHGLVRDKHGQKMSKSKGNVMDPITLIDKFGADALRAALVFGTEEGHDVVLGEDKIIGMRNFTNKIWNIGRFLYLNSNVKCQMSNKIQSSKNKTLSELESEFEEEKKEYLKLMDAFKFSQALGLVYEFIWHRFADYYIEKLKLELQNGNIKVLEVMMKIYSENLKMLHPFIPFVTEAVWQVFNKNSILENKINN